MSSADDPWEAALTTFVFLVGDTNPSLYSAHEPNRSHKGNINLEDVIRLAEADPIWAQRGKAIQGYAQLESSLANLLGDLGAMTPETASTIFYKITSADARKSIIEKLLHKKHGATFNLFWNSYFKQLRTIDNGRNEIAHWLAAAHVLLDDDEILHVGVSLIPPASLHDDAKNAPRRGLSELLEFQSKCDVFARAANMFLLTTKPSADSDPAAQKTWLDIFQQPLVYPLPTGHPLSRPPATPKTPPRS